MFALNFWRRAAVRAAALGLSLAAIGSTALYAMRVSPMVVEMETIGSKAVARVEVQNLNTGVLAFETKVTRLEFDDKGQATETPADGDFLVFPPQGSLPAGARQVVRLQWVGPVIDTSRAYYLSVNQLPIAMAPSAKTGAEVQIVYHMKAMVTVAPPGATPNVEVRSAKVADYQPPAATLGGPLPPKVPGIEVVLHNSGKRHAMMSAVRWVVEGIGVGGKPEKILITPDELNRVIGTGYVAGGGGVRNYQIPLAIPLKADTPVSVKFLQ